MKKPKKRTSLKEDAGKLLLDFGKLVFGGVIIGGILRSDIPHDMLIIGGVVALVVLCIVGLIMVIKEKNVENNSSPVKKE